MSNYGAIEMSTVCGYKNKLSNYMHGAVEIINYASGLNTVNFKELNQLKKFYSVTKNGLKRLQNNTFGVD
jgi:hypothetical protein